MGDLIQTNPRQFNPITKITIENFQSHKITELIPAGAGQLTVIVGQSRQGKTAIFRALRWLFYNAPDGADFIRWGCTFARVTAEYGNGTEVTRYRTAGGINRYITKSPDGTDQVYEGFGRGAVPLEVRQITGVDEVEIGEGLTLNLNMAEQLDAPFLGGKSTSGTARAKVLGKLAGTEEVDLAGKLLGTDLYRWRRDKESLEKAIIENKAKLQGYEYLPGLISRINKLSSIIGNVKLYTERRDKLEQARQEYYSVAMRANDARIKMLKCRDIVDGLEPIGKDLEIKAQRMAKMENIIADYNRCVWGIEQAEISIGRTAGIDVAWRFISDVDAMRERKRNLARVKTESCRIEDELKAANDLLAQSKHLPEADQAVMVAINDDGRKDKLSVLMKQWEQTKIAAGEEEKNILRAMETVIIEVLLKKCEQYMANRRNMEQLNLIYGRNAADIMHETKEIEAQKMAQVMATEEYLNALKQAGKCPTCGSQTIEFEQISSIL